MGCAIQTPGGGLALKSAHLVPETKRYKSIRDQHGGLVWMPYDCELRV